MKTHAVCKEILVTLEKKGDPDTKTGMKRFGITTEKAFGVSIPVLRDIARHHRKDHELAQLLWESGFHEARILASMVEDPAFCTEAQMEEWALEFNSWDLCDQVCMGLISRAPFAVRKAREWAQREEEFVRRAGFALMACLALKRSHATDEELLGFFPLMEQYACDERNFVRKAVNWALRQAGKRNRYLHAPATELAEKLMQSDNRTAVWIGRDAYRELNGEAVRRKLGIT